VPDNSRAKYGKFLGVRSTIMPSGYLQAHHIDTDFYDRVYLAELQNRADRGQCRTSRMHWHAQVVLSPGRSATVDATILTHPASRHEQ
jgi:hypothetical protein